MPAPGWNPEHYRLVADLASEESMADSYDSRILERFEVAQRRLVLQSADLSLATLAQMVESNAIDIRPEFQRRERWSTNKRSALIESFLLNIPIPPLYLAEDDFGSYSVIDGKQRLSAITDFMSNRLALNGLERFGELEGATYEMLPMALQNFLAVRPSIRAVTLLRQSDSDLKYEVFHRLNSGGEPLNAQEIRNVLYRGPLNDLVVHLGEHPFLRNQLKIRNEKSPNYATMLDAEWVLRFLTLRELWENFSGDLKYSMDRFMAEHQQEGPMLLNAMASDFLATLEVCESLWGDVAFKRSEHGQWRDQALAGMYDAEMVAVHILDPSSFLKLDDIRPRALDLTSKLFEENPAFSEAVRTGTNTPSRLRARVEIMASALMTLL
jgi:hypothetical protein